MIKEIPFTKMHGIGNDYIYIDCMERVPENLPQLAIEMSDRHTGVGGDGIILICPSECADFKMRILMQMAPKRECAATAAAVSDAMSTNPD